MNAKKVLPLALLHAAGGRIKGKTRLQKLAFLAEQELKDKGIDPYEFVPYRYGPFSDDLMSVIESLEREGLIEITETHTFGGEPRFDYSLTEKGANSAEANFPDVDNDDLTLGTPEPEQKRLWELYEIAANIVTQYNNMPISNLIDQVYDEYPSYAKNSVLN